MGRPGKNGSKGEKVSCIDSFILIHHCIYGYPCGRGNREMMVKMGKMENKATLGLMDQ